MFPNDAQPCPRTTPYIHDAARMNQGRHQRDDVLGRIVVFGGSVRAVIVRVLGSADSGSGGGYEVKVLSRSNMGMAGTLVLRAQTAAEQRRRVAHESQFGLLRILAPLHYSLCAWREGSVRLTGATSK